MPLNLFNALTWGTVATAVGSACLLALVGGSFAELPRTQNETAVGHANPSALANTSAARNDSRRAQAPLDRGAVAAH